MAKVLLFPSYAAILLTATLTTIGVQSEVNAQHVMYSPIPLRTNNEISDGLTDRDIPTGEGGFSRDYLVRLQAEDQVVIDLTSDEFDTVVKLIATDGLVVGENDDGPDGTTNSLLFARITETGNYTVRVLAFGQTSGGNFNLKVTRLRQAEDM